jgi:hypothetical protein
MRPLSRAVEAVDDEDTTQPLAAAEAPDAHAPTARRARRPPPALGPIDPVAPASTHRTVRRGVGPWVAVAALILFAFVLLGLLAGFLA